MHLRHAGTVLPHPLLIVTAVTLTLLLSLGRSGTHADHEPDTALPPLSEIAVDLDTTGNSATSLGPREDCASVGPNDTLQIDVTVKGVPPFDPGTFSGGIAGFGFDLLYDPTVIKVTAVDLDFLHASAGARIPFDIIDPLPDTDGVFRFDSGDLSQNFESGDGVLARIALQAVGTGASILRLAYATSPYYDPDPPAVMDASATIYEVTSVRDAAVSVGDLSVCNDVDTDGDTVPDLSDNCPTTFNPDQVDTDSDSHGDLCDEDDDDDGFLDTLEIKHGSDHLNPDSTPEYVILARDLTTCLDGIDNDLDGLIDTADPGCPFELPPPPPNDDFANATPTESGFSDYLNWLSAAFEPGELLPCGGLGRTVWYSFTPASDTIVRIDFSPHTIVAAYTGSSLPALSLLACESPLSVEQKVVLIIEVPAGTTVYFQLARADYTATTSTISIHIDTDGDDVFHPFDNCPDTTNPNQADVDRDGIGDACDPTPSHDLAVTNTNASTANVHLRRTATGTVTAAVEVTNLRDHPDTASIRLIGWDFPRTCGIQGISRDSPKTVGPLGTTTIALRVHFDCSAGYVPPGDYPVLLIVEVSHYHNADGFETAMSNNRFSITTTLRIH